MYKMDESQEIDDYNNYDFEALNSVDDLKFKDKSQTDRPLLT